MNVGALSGVDDKGYRRGGNYGVHGVTCQVTRITGHRPEPTHCQDSGGDQVVAVASAHMLL